MTLVSFSKKAPLIVVPVTIIISRSLPMGLGIDGMRGLNFFKNKELTIDFKLSEIQLK